MYGQAGTFTLTYHPLSTGPPPDLRTQFSESIVFRHAYKASASRYERAVPHNRITNQRKQ
jgi:hypothetical protein